MTRQAGAGSDAPADQAGAPRAPMLLALAIAAVTLLARLRDLVVLARDVPAAADFGVFATAGARWLAGGPLYDVAALGVAPFGAFFKLPPIAAVLLAPLGWLPLDAALTAWRLAIVGGTALSAWAVAAALGWGWRDPRGPLLVAVALASSAVTDELGDGQLQVIALAATAGGLWATSRGWNLVGGAVLALGVPFKLFPAVFVLPALLQARWRTVVGFGAMLAGLAAAGVVATGLEANVRWLGEVVGVTSASTNWDSNQSLSGVLLRLELGPLGDGASLVRAAPAVPWVAAAVALAQVLAFSASAWVIWRSGPDRPGSVVRLAAGTGLVIGATLLTLPTAWLGYQVLLVVPLACLAGRVVPAHPSSRWTFPMGLGLAFVVLWAVSGSAVLLWAPVAVTGAAVIATQREWRGALAAALLTGGAGLWVAGWPFDGWFENDGGFLTVLCLWAGLLLAAWPSVGGRVSRRAVALLAALALAGLTWVGGQTWRDVQRAESGIVRRVAPAGVPSVPLASWDGGIELLAAALDGSRPGEPVAVELTWRSTRTQAEDYTVFVHLIDRDGRRCGGRDGFPGGGRAPTSSWRAGDYIIDQRAVALEAGCGADGFDVVVGLYTLRDLQRLGRTDEPGLNQAVVGRVDPP